MDERPTPPSPEERFLERAKELDFAHKNRLHGALPRSLTFRFLRQAFARLATPPKRAKVEAVARPDAGVAITFVGHGTAMITAPGTRALVDPMLTNFLYGLRRARAAALAERDLADTSLVLITHAHPDTLHPPSLSRVPKRAAVVVPPRCAALVRPLGFRQVIELGVGERESAGGVEVTAVAARHDTIRGGLDRMRRGAQGYVVRAAGRSIYAAGNTGYFSGFGEIGARFSPDVALLPITGYEPAASRTVNLSPLDAVYALEDLGAAWLVPLGWGAFPLGYERPDEPLAWLRQAAAERNLTDRLRILGYGETMRLS